jgi:hypothetical protein
VERRGVAGQELDPGRARGLVVGHAVADEQQLAGREREPGAQIAQDLGLLARRAVHLAERRPEAPVLDDPLELVVRRPRRDEQRQAEAPGPPERPERGLRAGHERRGEHLRERQVGEPVTERDALVVGQRPAEHVLGDPRELLEPRDPQVRQVVLTNPADDLGPVIEIELAERVGLDVGALEDHAVEVEHDGPDATLVSHGRSPGEGPRSCPGAPVPCPRSAW